MPSCRTRRPAPVKTSAFFTNVRVFARVLGERFARCGSSSNSIGSNSLGEAGRASNGRFSRRPQVLTAATIGLTFAGLIVSIFASAVRTSDNVVGGGTFKSDTAKLGLALAGSSRFGSDAEVTGVDIGRQCVSEMVIWEYYL